MQGILYLVQAVAVFLNEVGLASAHREGAKYMWERLSCARRGSIYLLSMPRVNRLAARGGGRGRYGGKFTCGKVGGEE